MIKSLLETSAEVKKQTAEQCSQDAEAAARLIAESLAAGGKLMLCSQLVDTPLAYIVAGIAITITRIA